MMKRTAHALILFGVVLLGAAPRAQAPAETRADAALRRFSEAVERYAELRARLEEPLPPVRAARRVWTTILAKRYLASAMRAARRDARPGSLFAPDIAAIFRQRLDAVPPAERLTLTIPGDDESGLVILVNEPVAMEWLVPVPSPALEHLPPLPGGIDYRLVGTALVLWDEDAEIVIDVLPDALD